MAWLREPVPALALGLAAAAEVVGVHGADPGRLLLVALLAIPLLWRRRHPRAVLFVITAAFAVQLPWTAARIFETTFACYVCLVVAAYSVGRHASGRSARLVGFGSAVIVGLVIGSVDRSVGSGLLAVGILAAPVCVGEAVRVRASARRLLTERAEEIEASTAAVAAARALETRALAAADIQVALDGRLRSMLSAAARARDLLATDPGRAGVPIAEIEAQGRLALADMRSTLSAMRDPDGAAEQTAGPAEDDAAAAPAASTLEPALTIAVVGFAVVEAIALAADEGGIGIPLSAVLGAAMAAPLSVRGRWPVAAAVVGWAAACLLVQALGIAGAVVIVGMLLAGSAGAARTPRQRRSGLVVGLAGVVAVNVAGGLSGAGDYVLPMVLVGLAWLGGAAMRQQEGLLSEVEQQATEVRRMRDTRASAAAVGERLRLARELHDVVAHHLVVMVVQAGAARRTVERGRAGAVEALAAIEATGAEARAELGALLALVAPERDGSGPAHGLVELRRLVDRVRAAGLVADLHVAGRPRSLPGGIDMVAHRVVQESLTNVIRHAGATRVDVRICYLDDRLSLEITDDGRGVPPGPTRGLGISGMRERVALYGGSFEIAAPADRGVRVCVDLPLQLVAPEVPA